MEFLTISFDIASSVLRDLIIDLMTGKVKEVVKEQLEEIVASKVIDVFKLFKQKPEEQKRQEITSKILDEINTLAKKDPDLKILPGKIALEKPVTKPSLPFQDRGVEKELEVYLERLKNIIAQRREELGLPPESKEENLKDNLRDWEPVAPPVEDENSHLLNVPEPVKTEYPPEWEAIKPETETPWQQRIKASLRKIQINHLGGEVRDE
ncbi:hypothetical protein [Microcoleus sp.]|uniref:hypothetical protein n=1 Tax=Microcoleus sp. TaxID=44472 RepID=UPI0035269A14